MNAEMRFPPSSGFKACLFWRPVDGSDIKEGNSWFVGSIHTIKENVRQERRSDYRTMYGKDRQWVAKVEAAGLDSEWTRGNCCKRNDPPGTMWNRTLSFRWGLIVWSGNEHSKYNSIDCSAASWKVIWAANKDEKVSPWSIILHCRRLTQGTETS